MRNCSAQAAAKQECPRKGVGIPEEIKGGREERELQLGGLVGKSEGARY